MGSIGNGFLDKPRYIDFPCLEPGTAVDGKQALNRWSSTITKGTRVKIFNKFCMITNYFNQAMTFLARK